MFILSDLNGRLLQFGNFNIDADSKIKEFSSMFNTEVIATEDETICLKASKFKSFNLKVENKQIIDVISLDDVINIDEKIQTRIEETKDLLKEFLQNNPLLFTDGKLYSVTADKQTLLANAIQVYQMKIQASLPAILKWNATGEECTAWSVEDLTALALAIAEYVEPLVAKQQALEVQIRNCTSLEELNAIVIDYEVL